MNDSLSFKKALQIFEKQIECIMADNREAQIELYAEDLRYEFPFATDRPRLIEGREAFQDVMTLLWEKNRKQGVRIVGCNHEFHATDETGLFVAEFVFEAEVAGKRISVSFVQFTRICDDHILEVREYFSPSERNNLKEQKE